MADFGAEKLDAFRAEARDWLKANYPAELRDPKVKTDPEAGWAGQAFLDSDDPQIVWMRRVAEKGWTAPDLAGGLRRRRFERGRGPRAGPGDDQGRLPNPAGLLRDLDAGPGAAGVRRRGSEEGTPAQDHQGRDPLVPGLFRAGRGIRPGLPGDPLRGQGRPLSDQWPEDLDQLRQQGRLVLLPGAHGHHDQARRHQFRADRHEDAGRRDPPDQADQRRQPLLRDLFHRREGSQGPAGGQAQRRLGDRQAAAAV